MLRWLDDTFAVSPQISPGDVVLLKRDGVSHLICNRPDHEEHGQPTVDDIRNVANAQGVPLDHIPVGVEGVTLPIVKRFRAVMDQATPKVVAYCRTGTRCTILWAMASAIDHDPKDLIAKAADQGYEIGHLAGMLQTLNDMGGFPD